MGTATVALMQLACPGPAKISASISLYQPTTLWQPAHGPGKGLVASAFSR